MSIKQISVFLENKPGSMLRMTEELAGAGVDMRALSLAETSDFGIARIIASDTYKAAAALKDAGYVYRVTDVLAVAVPDRPGGLHEILELLAAAGINVEYMYAFLAQKTPGTAYMIFHVADNEAATKAFSGAGIKMLDGEAL